MMRSLNIKDKISELGVALPSAESFWGTGDLTALRHNNDVGFYRSNYERGLLVYALVAAHRPKVVLEFGTGRGYGSLCMARAFVEHDIEGTIYTVDSRRYEEKQPWPINTGDGARIDNLSWADVWPEHFPHAWLERVECLTGMSVKIMDSWRSSGLPNPELAFIDGGHDYLTVKHDYYSTLRIADSSLRILFDDYAAKPGFGVRKLVDEEVSSQFPVEVLLADDDWIAPKDEYGVSRTDGMVFLDCNEADMPWQNGLPLRQIEDNLARCRRQMQRQERLAAVKNFVRPLALRLGLR